MPYHSSSQHLKEAKHKSINIKKNLFKFYFLESKGNLWKQIMNIDKTSLLFRMKFLTGNMGEKRSTLQVTGPKAVVVKTSKEPIFFQFFFKKRATFRPETYKYHLRFCKSPRVD